MDEQDEHVNNKQRRKARRAEAVTEYKERTRRLRNLNRDEDRTEVQNILKEDLERANDLYPVVKKKLDGTMADARHIRELVNLGFECSKRINATSKPFEMKRVIKNLMKAASDECGRTVDQDEFAAYIVQNHVNRFLLRPPTFEFFYGALPTEDLQVAEKRERKVREKMVASTSAVTAKEKDIAGPDIEQDSTPKEVEQIYTRIKRLVENKKEPAPFFKTLVDPKSFTQTVENIFHVSFLVKEGKVGVKGENPKRAVLTVGDDAPKEEGSIQSVLSFSMDDYEAWLGFDRH